MERIAEHRKTLERYAMNGMDEDYIRKQWDAQREDLISEHSCMPILLNLSGTP